MNADTTYAAYLLRFHRAGTHWRATLDDLHTGQRQRFATLPALLEHLVGALAPEVPDNTHDTLPIHTQWVQADVFDTQPRGRKHEPEPDSARGAAAVAEPEARPRARREPECFSSDRL